MTAFADLWKPNEVYDLNDDRLNLHRHLEHRNIMSYVKHPRSLYENICT